ncbi:hypothetical protein [Gimesia algae]|uniref:Uncharacterized protein n=1 Tax=Gimesia algae TaxID=2527971 RepID=A0A517VAY9_9PLAN|nr:hypothetical protein [Gimesia algae]QDT90170.1 hypothetical protein Pan161_18200 [Gimesia algae]
MVDINLIGSEIKTLSPSLLDRIRRIKERAIGTIAEYSPCLWIADLICTSDDARVLLIPFKAIADTDGPNYDRIAEIEQLLEHWDDSKNSQDMLEICEILDLLIKEDIYDWDSLVYWDAKLILESLHTAVVRQVDMLKTNLS